MASTLLQLLVICISEVTAVVAAWPSFPSHSPAMPKPCIWLPSSSFSQRDGYLLAPQRASSCCLPQPLILQKPSTKPWDALPSKPVSKTQTHYIEIIRMLLVTYPHGPARAAIRYLTHSKSSLTLTPLIPTSSPKTSQAKDGDRLNYTAL